MKDVKSEMNILDDEIKHAWDLFKKSKERGDDSHLIDCAWLKFHTLYKLKKQILKECKN